MALLYDAWHSLSFVDQKIKLPTQSAETRICMGKWPFPKLGDLVYCQREGPRLPEFFPT